MLNNCRKKRLMPPLLCQKPRISVKIRVNLLLKNALWKEYDQLTVNKFICRRPSWWKAFHGLEGVQVVLYNRLYCRPTRSRWWCYLVARLKTAENQETFLLEEQQSPWIANIAYSWLINCPVFLSFFLFLPDSIHIILKSSSFFIVKSMAN